MKRFVQLRAQVVNVPDSTAIEMAVRGLKIGQCALRFARDPPRTIDELFTIMAKYVKSDNDLHIRVEE